MVGVQLWRQHWRTVLILFAFLGAALFAKGFLQVRKLIEDKSSLTPKVEPIFFPSINGWLPNRHKKFLLLVVDALRIDFVLPSKRTADKSIAWYDKLTILSELAKNEPSRAKLFHFIADPPTATTQRLSGIAAGTLPAFVEVASNFAESSLGSDNFVYQILQSPHYPRFDMYGDDTWLHLFPLIKERSKGTVAGFHSFHLFDLHTVDNNVKKHLFPAVELGSFDVAIAHFLGVDHCGHKYGPAQGPCGDKLTEMDQVIRKVIADIDDNTMLIVFGDHGMTDNGDHGGISPKEIGSVLFTYKKGQPSRVEEFPDAEFWKIFFAKVDAARRRLLNVDEMPFYADANDDSILAGSLTQIDFTPTISLLMGIPIPFGNVGNIIPEILVDHDLYKGLERTEARLQNLKYLFDAVRLNAHQVKVFLDRSMELREDNFDAHSLAELFAKLAAAEGILQQIRSDPSEESLVSGFMAYYDFLLSTQNYCRAVWADFSMPAIMIGLVIGTVAVLILLISIFWKNCNFSTFYSLGLATFHSVSLSTTSFITFEDGVVRFLLTSLVTQNVLWSFFKGPPSSKQLLRGLTLLLLIRLTSYTGACREEQFPHCQVLTHRSIVWEFSLPLFVCIVIGFVGLFWTFRQCHTSLGEFRESALSFVGHLLYFCIMTLLGTHWMWTWMADTSESKQDDAIVTDEIMAVIVPRALFVMCGVSSLLFRKNGGLWLLSIAALVGIVLRPFAGWTLLVAGCAILKIGSALFATVDPASIGVFFYLTGMHLFFITGHQTTLTNLQWEAAFIGFRSTIQFVAAILMALNTFAGPILALSAMCLTCSPEVILVYLWYHVAQLIASAIFTAILMHHLMVWKMFTPRFLFQACTSLISLLIICIAYLIKTNNR